MCFVFLVTLSSRHSGYLRTMLHFIQPFTLLYWKRIKNVYITHNCVFTVIIKTIHPALYSIYITWPHPTSNLSHHPISCEVCSFTNHNYTCTSFLLSSIKHHLTLGTHRTANTILFTPYIQHVTLHPFILGDKKDNKNWFIG